MTRRKMRAARPSPALTGTRDPPLKICFAVLCLAGIAAYFNSLDGQFIIDDKLSIIQNEAIRRLWPLHEFFQSSRPLVDYSLAINYLIDGLHPRGYHIFNVVIHLLAGLTLFDLIRRTPFPGDAPSKDILAFFCALLWLVHPLQTQAVTYIVQRSESMMGLFYLFTLYCLLSASLAIRAWPWYLAGITVCAAGMGCKAVMVSAPIVAILYDRTFLAGTFRVALKKRWPFYLGLAATWLVLPLLGIVQGIFAKTSVDPITVGFGFTGVSPWQYLRTQPEIILHYLRLCLIPIGQCIDYGWTVQNRWPVWSLNAAVILCLLILALWAFRQYRASGFLGVAFFLILAPTSSFIPIRDLAFEHRMYLPLASVIIAIVYGCASVIERAMPRGTRGLTVALPIVVATAFLLLTISRNSLYANPIALWTDTISKTNPAHARPHNALGFALLSGHRADEAIVEFNKAITLDPYYAGAYANLATAMLYKGDHAAAIELFHKALAISPYEFDEEFHFLLGSALIEIPQFDEAARELSLAVQMRPDHAEAWCNLGNALRGLRKYPEAESALRKSIALHPKYPEALANLGIVLAESDQAVPAIQAFSQALQNAPAAASPQTMSLRCHLQLAALFQKQSQMGDARSHYEAVLAMDPDNQAAKAGLSKLPP